VAGEDLDRIEKSLDDESEEDARLRQQHGSAWNRPSSAALNSALREKAAGYRRVQKSHLICQMDIPSSVSWKLRAAPCATACRPLPSTQRCAKGRQLQVRILCCLPRCRKPPPVAGDDMAGISQRSTLCA